MTNKVQNNVSVYHMFIRYVYICTHRFFSYLHVFYVWTLKHEGTSGKLKGS